MENEYVMGIDFTDVNGGFERGAISVYKKDEGFKYLRTFHNEDDYEAEVNRVAQYYSIPKQKIFTEINKV